MAEQMAEPTPLLMVYKCTHCPQQFRIPITGTKSIPAKEKSKSEAGHPAQVIVAINEEVLLDKVATHMMECGASA